MTNPLPSPRLLLITDRRHATLPVVDLVAAAVEGGCRWIMVREKDLDRSALVALAREILEVAVPYGARVVINGDIEAAAAAGAHGAHVQSAGAARVARSALGKAALIGVSTHGLAEARLADASGPDYITVSPVFLTASKPGYGPELGLEGLARVCGGVSVPVIALAGVTADNAAGCVRAGAAGVATMGGIMRANDPHGEVRLLLDVLASRGTA